MEPLTSSHPAPPIDKERARNHALAQLSQAVWEASQFLTLPEIEEYVAGVLREVESDEP